MNLKPSQLQEGQFIEILGRGKVMFSFMRDYGYLNLAIGPQGGEPEDFTPIDFSAHPEVADEVWNLILDQQPKEN